MLYLSGGQIASALELLRRVCQPASRSMPHITARYSTKQVRPEVLEHYSNALIDDLILAKPGTFDDVGGGERGIRTVIIACESEDLEWLSYKPDFPDSVFHFTIYDGPKSGFASSVLEVMQEFPWNLRLINANERVDPYEKSRSAAPRSEIVAISGGARMLLDRISGNSLSPDDLWNLPSSDRLHLVRELCRSMHASREVEFAESPPVLFQARRRDQSAPINAFWSSAEINAMTIGATSRANLRERSTFLTPPEIAYDLARAAWTARDHSLPVRFGDPSMGPGILFAAMRQVSDQARFESAIGIEINPRRAEATARKWRRAGLEVVEGDFLTESPSGDWTLLLANPPYVRHQEITRSTAMLRHAIAQSTGIQLDGRADLYAYFLLGAHDWLAQGGTGAWLLPAEFLATDYGSAIRTYLTSKVTLKRLHIYDPDSPVFDNARISSTVVVYDKSPPVGTESVLLSFGGSADMPEQQTRISIDVMARALRWSWLTLTMPDQNDERLRIRDLFEVKRGIATGANRYFVLDEAQLEEYDVSDRWVRPLLPRSRYLREPVVDRDGAGAPVVTPRLWLIDTSDSIDQIRHTSPKFAKYLTLVEREVGGRSQVSKRRATFRQESRRVPTFVFVYMAKADQAGAHRFKWNRSEAVVLNTYLGLNLRPEFEEIFGAHADVLAALFAALRAVTSTELLVQGRIYVSGLLKLEPKDLERVRLDLPEALVRVVRSSGHVAP